MPAADQIERLVSVHTGQPADLNAVRVDAIREPVGYHTGLLGSGPDWSATAATETTVFVARYGQDDVRLEPAGRFSPSLQSGPPVAQYGEATTLRDAAATRADGRIRIELTWEVSGPVDPGVTVFVHALSEDGRLLAQADGDPIAGAFPFWQWPTGTPVTDIRILAIEESVHSVRVGLYDRGTGTRLPAVAPSGKQLESDAVTLQVAR